MKRRAWKLLNGVLFAWWFLLYNATSKPAVVVGPFYDLTVCNKVRADTDSGFSSQCWFGSCR